MSKLPHKNLKPGFKIADVKNLMELSGQNALVSILALSKRKQNVNEAAALLSDKKQLAALTEAKGMIADSKQDSKQPQKSGGFLSSLFGFGGGGGGNSNDSKSSAAAAAKDKNSDASIITNLVSTFGVPPSVAAMALQLEGSADAAALLLTNSEAVAQLESIIEGAENEGSGGAFGNKSGSSESQLVRDRLDQTLAEHNFLVRYVRSCPTSTDSPVKLELTLCLCLCSVCVDS